MREIYFEMNENPIANKRKLFNMK